MYIYCIYIIYICIWSRTPPWSTFSLFYWYLQYRTFIFPVHIPGCVWPYVYIYIHMYAAFERMAPLEKEQPLKKTNNQKKTIFWDPCGEDHGESKKTKKHREKAKQNKTIFWDSCLHPPILETSGLFYCVCFFFCDVFFCSFSPWGPLQRVSTYCRIGILTGGD